MKEFHFQWNTALSSKVELHLLSIFFIHLVFTNQRHSSCLLVGQVSWMTPWMTWQELTLCIYVILVLLASLLK